MGIFVWALRSQGLEPSVKCFCSMHELLYETKATVKEQYHNNFGCYRFIARPNASHLVPTFRKRWPRAWMEEWFYVKNDLKKREDIKEIIQRPIWSCFGLRRLKVNIDSDVETCQKPIVVPKVPTVGPAEASDDKAEEPQAEKVIKTPEILSPPEGADLPKMQKIPVATPKKRRMASVLEAVIETTKALSPAPKKIAEATKVQAEADAEARPSVPTESKPTALEDKTAGQIVREKTETPAPEAPNEDVDYIIRHASGKKLSKEEILEARHYAQILKCPKGALVFNGSDEDDFLYCVPDDKEISVCREVAKSMGFLKLEDGLSVMSKDDLADSLAYNSIKV
jgi:hypothetical protein